MIQSKLSFEEIDKRYGIKKEVGKIVKKLENYSKEIMDIPQISNYLTYFLQTPSRRKRLIKLLAVAKLTGGINKNIQKIINALEIINSAIFIHDDVIDHDHERKGKPTLNKLIGYERALLVGNMLYSLAISELNKLNCNEKLKKEIISDFTNVLFIENAGQYCDVYFRKNFNGNDLIKWEKMVIRHSGFYVISALKSIAKLNGAMSITKDLENYEKNCTLAGAAEDALMGFLGKKKPKGDLKNRGFTILVHYAIKGNQISLNSYTSKFLENRIKESSSIKQTKNYIAKKVQLSLDSLRKIEDCYDKEVLKYLVYQILEETK